MISFELIETFQNFLESGGTVLKVLFFTMVLLWGLVLERFSFIWLSSKLAMNKKIENWSSREDRHSWYAMRIRDKLVSEFKADLASSMPMIKTMVAVCPLLGLLGTVTGMIQVFDVMALSGTGDARSMASGISRATIPTMAGMVAALTGIYLASQLEGKINAQVESFASKLD
jgi:biopolymer transport protein ExbB